MNEEKFKLFPEYMNLKKINEDLILQKISGSKGETFKNLIAKLILDASQTSLIAKEYISFVLHQLSFRISILDKKDSAHLPQNQDVKAYFSSDVVKGTGELVYLTERLKNVSSETLKRDTLHELWHGFWFYIHHTPYDSPFFPKSLLQCNRAENAYTYPFTPSSTLEIDEQRKHISAVYKDFQNILLNLEEYFKNRKSHPLSKPARRLMNAIIRHGGYAPDQHIVACPDVVMDTIKSGKVFESKGYFYTIRAHEIVETGKNAKCIAYLTCTDHNDPICQTIAFVAYGLKRCHTYLVWKNISLDEPLAAQLNSDGKALFELLKKHKVNLDLSYEKLFSLTLPEEAIYKQFAGRENDVNAIMQEFLPKYHNMKDAILECDTVLMEMGPALHSMESYQNLFEIHRQEILKWMYVCSNETLTQNIPLELEIAKTPLTKEPKPEIKPESSAKPENAEILEIVGITDYLKTGTQSFFLNGFLTFSLNSLHYGMQSRDPVFAQKMNKIIGKMLNLVGCVSAFSYWGVGVFATTEMLLLFNDYYKLVRPQHAENMARSVSWFGLFPLARHDPVGCVVSLTGAFGGNYVAQKACDALYSAKPKRL